MNYSQLTIAVLEFLKKSQGEYAGLKAISGNQVVESVANGDQAITERLLNKAIKELELNGLLEVETRRVGLSQTSGFRYLKFDITGSGLRFLESLEQLAVKEGKSRPWMWSFVEKAATVGQLIQTAVAAIALIAK